MNVDQLLDRAGLPGVDVDVDEALTVVARRSNRRRRQQWGAVIGSLLILGMGGLALVALGPSDDDLDVAADADKDAESSTTLESPATDTTGPLVDLGPPPRPLDGERLVDNIFVWMTLSVHISTTAPTEGAIVGSLNECLDYRAEAIETDHRVRIDLYEKGIRAGDDCNGVLKTVPFSYESPIGDRRVVRSAEPGVVDIGVVYVPELAVPEQVPGDLPLNQQMSPIWEQMPEFGTQRPVPPLDDNEINRTTWWRMWGGGTTPDDACVTGPSWLTLLEGPAALATVVDLGPQVSSADVQGDLRTIHERGATGPVPGRLQMSWTENDRFLLLQIHRCDDLQRSVDAMVQFALGLTIP